MVVLKRNRSILCLGPPNSGKSVFCYLLFKSLKNLGNNACIMDADYYSPTYRTYSFASPEEMEEDIYFTPYGKKLDSLKIEVFKGLAQNIHAVIVHNGVIIMDGVGKYSESTEFLLSIATMLIVLCSNDYDINKSSKDCGYIKDGTLIHPFDFYEKKCAKYIQIKTHYKNKKIAFFNEKQLKGELFDLEREEINEGNILNIPKETQDKIKEIGKFILKKWIK